MRHHAGVESRVASVQHHRHHLPIGPLGIYIAPRCKSEEGKKLRERQDSRVDKRGLITVLEDLVDVPEAARRTPELRIPSREKIDPC